MRIDHINVKIFALQSAGIDLSPAIPVFHQWIRDSTLGELLIDVADYRHVPSGPGVMLIAHEANYSLDLAGNRLGLLYNRKSTSDGNTQDKLLHAFASALTAASRLEREPAFAPKLTFNAGDIEVIINDRLLAPNTPETWSTLEPEFETFLNGLYGHQSYTLHHAGEPRERFRVQARTQKPVEVATLLGTLTHA